VFASSLVELKEHEAKNKKEINKNFFMI